MPNEEEMDEMDKDEKDLIVGKAFVKDIVRFELLDIHHGSPYTEE